MKFEGLVFKLNTKLSLSTFERSKMHSTLSIFILFATGSCLVLATGNSRKGIQNVNVGPQPKGSLGQVGNKLYEFARWTGNWLESKAYCEASGWRLATIETDEELKFLESKYEMYVFWGWHWTAARDAHSQKQFVWDNSELDIDVNMNWLSNGTLDTMPNDQYMTCATFHSISVNESAMGITDCSRDNGHVLCEYVLE